MHHRHLLLHADLEAAAAGDQKGSAGPLAGKLYNEHLAGFMPENMSQDDDFESDDTDDDFEEEDEFDDEGDE